MTNTARPNFQAQFSTPPDRRTLRFVVDQIDHSQEVSYSSSGKTIRWTPSTNLMPGNHVVDVSAVGQNRETFATHWTFTTPRGNSGNGNPIQPPPVNRPTGLQVNNINPGVVLGSRFNVSGRGVPGSSVTVQVEYPKQDIVSQMTGVMLRFQSQGRVDNNGNFSIPMDAQEVPRGEPMTITVTDSANSPIVSVRTEKGADTQVQPNGGNSNPPTNGSFNPSNNVERFYDQQNHFGMDIPRGWGRVSPDPKTQFKISNNRGGFFGVGAGQARNPQEVTNTLIIELNKQGNRVNSQKQIKLGGLSATRIDFTSNNNSNSGGVVVSCVTGRNQTFIVGAESSNMSDFQFTQDLNSLLNTFRINTP